jgi:hypothetical protein
MRTHLFRGVLALVLALAVCAPAVAQSTGMVKGRVVDAEGKPVADARITVEFPAGGRKNETKTNAKGEYIQIGLVPGQYKVTATKDKVGTQMFEIRVRVGSPAELNFQLTPSSGLSAEDVKKNAAVQASFTAGVEASKSGNHDAAIAKFTEAAALLPNCADCYYNIGFAHSQKQQYAEAGRRSRRPSSSSRTRRRRTTAWPRSTTLSGNSRKRPRPAPRQRNSPVERPAAAPRPSTTRASFFGTAASTPRQRPSSRAPSRPTRTWPTRTISSGWPT